jgi:hypothetical protein
MTKKLNIVRSFNAPAPGTIAGEIKENEAYQLQLQGIAAFREAIRIQQKFESPHYNLAVAYLKLGDMNAAASELKILRLLNLDQKHILDLEVALAGGNVECSKPDH